MGSHQALMWWVSQGRVVVVLMGNYTMFFTVWMRSEYGLTAYTHTVRP